MGTGAKGGFEGAGRVAETATASLGVAATSAKSRTTDISADFATEAATGTAIQTGKEG